MPREAAPPKLDRLIAEEGGIGGGRFWPRFYDAAATILDAEDFDFINLGFLDGDDPVGAPADRPQIAERLSERLYDRALAGVDIAGATVLEVGCGRGGGCAHMVRTRAPAQAIGVDLSAPLVEWCRRRYRLPQLRFEQGDAQLLPLAGGSVDVVVNVESSHCYPSRSAFFAEVRRVLRPGGRLALADVLFGEDAKAGAEAVEQALEDAGLRIDAGAAITGPVVAARRAVSRSPAFRARVARMIPRPEDAAVFARLFCLEGTDGFAALAERRFEYWCWTATRP